MSAMHRKAHAMIIQKREVEILFLGQRAPPGLEGSDKSLGGIIVRAIYTEQHVPACSKRSVCTRHGEGDDLTR